MSAPGKAHLVHKDQAMWKMGVSQVGVSKTAGLAEVVSLVASSSTLSWMG